MQISRFFYIPGLAVLLAAFLALLSLSSAAGAELTGAAVTITGDTIEVNGQRVRLYGVTAPGIDQFCTGARAQWRCGLVARLMLDERIGSSPVICRRQVADGQNRILGRCRLDDGQETELNRWMVTSGWALASETNGQTYKAEEAGARRRGAGLWRDGFSPSDDWRRIAERAERAPGDVAVDCSSCSLRHRALNPDATVNNPPDASE